MKADFPIVEAEAFPPELRQRVGTPLFRALTQQRAMLQSHLTHRDNFNCAVVEWTFKHGVETLFANPLPNGVTPLAFEVLEAWDPTTRAPMSVVGTPRFNRTRRDDGLLPITVEYDLKHTEPSAELAATAAQTLTTGIETPITWNSNTFNGSAISVVSSSDITVSEAGYYVFTANLTYDANVTGVRDIWFRKNATALSANLAKGFVQAEAVEDGSATGVSSSAAFQLSAGDFVRCVGFQNSGGNLNVRGDSAGGRNCQVFRTRNDSTPTGTVRGVLWGG